MQEARKAILEDISQMKEKEVFSPIRASSLTPTERLKALRTINLIKEKRDGVLRTCVDSKPQRVYIAKEDALSPTMFLDSNRHVAVADVSGAYRHAESFEVAVLKVHISSFRLALFDVIINETVFKRNWVLLVAHGFQDTFYLNCMLSIAVSAPAAEAHAERIVCASYNNISHPSTEML